MREYPTTERGMQFYAMRKIIQGYKRIKKLIRLKAPKAIIANELINVILPRMMQALNIVPEGWQAIADTMCKHYTARLGMCAICKRLPYIDHIEELCFQCSSKQDQLMAECGDYEKEEREKRENNED